MKLYYSSASPYARKVIVVAHELGLDRRIELVPANVVPLKPEPTISKANPLAKVPTLVTDEGEPLYDSAVITEYLELLGTSRKVIPPSGPARWRVKRLEALGDGMTDAGILCRYEITMRPAEKQSSDWIAGQTAKVNQALDQLEQEAPGFGAEPISARSPSPARSAGSSSASRAARCGRGRPKLFAWYDAFCKRPVDGRHRAEGLNP